MALMLAHHGHCVQGSIILLYVYVCVCADRDACGVDDGVMICCLYAVVSHQIDH